jgi:UDP-N-acetylglucosamine--N-acetylmuramyl-(pentapeptide) pyrophosphoryl-undecaprenol N-acetylglucosamine transferase
MKILLVGGGSGGHITPLLAVAHELKALQDTSVITVGICERGSKFRQLFEDSTVIDEVYEIRAGKYRRYAGVSRLEKMTDVKTMALNVRDTARVTRGYSEARKLLKAIRPDGILIKGGFVGVPVGLAAASLKIPFITHDSDTMPGLANRIISRWATAHATGMPAEFYAYPKEKLHYTGIPVSSDFKHVSSDIQKELRAGLGLGACSEVIAVIGGSQGGSQLNEDVVGVAGRLMQKHPDLGILHIAGDRKRHETESGYSGELLADERRKVVVTGFVTDAYRYTGAADIVISRASATVMAELEIQGKAVILVPGQLAGNHQVVNARHMADAKAAVHVAYGDREGLYGAISTLLEDKAKAAELAKNLHGFAKPHAARDLAKLIMQTFKVGEGHVS